MYIGDGGYNHWVSIVCTADQITPSLRHTFVSLPRRVEHSLVPQWQGGGVTVREVSV